METKLNNNLEPKTELLVEVITDKQKLKNMLNEKNKNDKDNNKKD